MEDFIDLDIFPDDGQPREDFLWLDHSEPHLIGNGSDVLDLSDNLDLAVPCGLEWETETYTTSSPPLITAPLTSPESVILPPELVTIPSASATRKRKFKDCLSEFVGTTIYTVPRRRNSFTAERRDEVSQVRKAGACNRCRILKMKVGSLDHLPIF